MVDQRTSQFIKGIVAVFLIVASVPVLYATLPQLDLTITDREDYNVAMPDDYGIDYDWSTFGEKENTEIITHFHYDSFILETYEDWHSGNTFNGSTPDALPRGNLQLGYLNGTSDDNNFLYLRFDSDSGDVQDYSGNDLTISTYNSPVRGEPGVLSTNSTAIDDDDDGYSAPGDGDLSFSDRDVITVSTWMKSNESGIGYLVYKKNSFFLVENADDTVTFQVNGEDVSTTGGIPNNEWHHVAATYDGTELRIYVDGELNNTFVADTIVPSNTNPVYIGRDSNGGADTFNGWIDEPRVHGEGWTQNDMDKAYLYGKPFYGDYSSPFSHGSEDEHTWDTLYVNATVPSDTNLTANFTALDGDGDYVYHKTFDVVTGSNEFNISQETTSQSVVDFKGTSSNASQSWKVHRTETEYVEDTEIHLQINDTTVSVTGDYETDGFFYSPNFVLDTDPDDDFEEFYDLSDVAYDSYMPDGTGGEFTVEVSDDNFTSVKDTITRDLGHTEGETLKRFNLSGLDEGGAYRVTIFLRSNTSSVNPYLSYIEISGETGSRRFFPTREFSMETFIILLVLGVGIILAFETFFNRPRW